MFINTFYNSIIRSNVVAFGSLFSGITIVRSDKDSGVNNQTIAIPISYSPKEKWLRRIQEDPTLETEVYAVIPRMGFEVTNYTYDPARKLNRLNKVVLNGTTNRQEVYSGTPYNIEISMYILTKTTEDALQIVEQILPNFSPEYTMSLKLISPLDIIQNTPIVLNSVSVVDEYDGDFNTRRFVTHTLSFTMKAMLYGRVSSHGVILNTTANITAISATIKESATAVGSPIVQTILEGY